MVRREREESPIKPDACLDSPPIKNRGFHGNSGSSEEMMRRIFAVLFTAALLESALSGVAAAQGRCSLQFTFCTGDTFPLPPGAQCDFNGDPDVCFHCSVPSNQCAPPGAAAETPCRSCTAGSPINLATGDTFITQVDLGLAGLGSGLAL